MVNSLLQEQAQRLTQQGLQLLNQGNPSGALQTWQQTTKMYRQLHNQEGITGSQINQSLAMQALGQYSNACKILTTSLQLQQWVCQTQFVSEPSLNELKSVLAQPLQNIPSLSVNATALQNLGDVLRQIGKPNTSALALQQALAISQDQVFAADYQGIRLSVANTQRTLYSQAAHLYQQTDDPLSKSKAALKAQEEAQEALKLYQQISDETSTASTAVKARLRWLTLVLELYQWNQEHSQKLPDLSDLLEQIKPQIQINLQQLLASDFSQLSVIEAVYGRLTLAECLLKMSQNQLLHSLLPSGDRNALLKAFTLSQVALSKAQRIDSLRGESFAYGLAGKLYRQSRQLPEAQQAFYQAISLAQAVHAPDVAYQWQEQLGQLYEQQGAQQKAMKVYAAAINSLEAVRSDILSVAPDIQFYFKERVEPVYRSYMRLLLAAPHPQLEQVIATNEKLHLAELQNYLRCQRPDLVSLGDIHNPGKHTAVIHLINVGERFVEIVQASDQSIHRITPSNPQSIQVNIDNLLRMLQVDSYSVNSLALKPEKTILQFSRPLYQQLIAPLKPYLPSSGTLVFVLDARLQGVPMSLLHDGKDYLVKQYSISETTGVEMETPKKLNPSKMRTLIAALSQASPSFKAPNAPSGLFPLSKALGEVKAVKAAVSSEELIDQAFTAERLQKDVEENDYSILHISSHGQFSSDPAQTVILAWNKPIDVSQFNLLLQSKSQVSQAALELLVLSACESAKGDQRSTLGLAGLAAQAGARSTLASLWLVDEAATAELMSEFYSRLSHGATKAEALRQAQLSLIENPRSHHPFFWASFLLVGSWL